MQMLCCVGACYLDTILTVPYFPSEDSKLRASSLSRRRGGNCANSLEVLQSILSKDKSESLKLSLISVVPARDSPSSKHIAESLGPKVDLAQCIYRDSHTEAASSYIIKSQDADTRTIVNYNELPEMNEDEFASAIATFDLATTWFHFEGRIPDVTLGCVKELRRRIPTVKVSVEVEKAGREGLPELAEEADVIFFSKSWAQSRGFNHARDFLVNQISSPRRAEMMFVTWGDAGAAAVGTNDEVVECSATHVDHVVDTVGAGDTFTAAALYGLICKQGAWTLKQVLDYANMLAGRKVSIEGFDIA